MAESTSVNLVQPATSACDGAAAAAGDVAAAAPLEPTSADNDEELPSTSTSNRDPDRDEDDTGSTLPPLSSLIAPKAAAQSVVVALHRIASTTIPAAAVPVAAGSAAAAAGPATGGVGIGRARATSVAVPPPSTTTSRGSIRRSSTAVVLNVARTLRQQVRPDPSTQSWLIQRLS